MTREQKQALQTLRRYFNELKQMADEGKSNKEFGVLLAYYDVELHNILRSLIGNDFGHRNMIGGHLEPGKVYGMVRFDFDGGTTYVLRKYEDVGCLKDERLGKVVKAFKIPPMGKDEVPF